MSDGLHETKKMNALISRPVQCFYLYGSGIQRYVYETKKVDDASRRSSVIDGIPNLPEQREKQLPKIFVRAASACKVQFDESLADNFRQNKQKTEGDLPSSENIEFKVKPFVHGNQSRPISRAKFDESIPIVSPDHFVGGHECHCCDVTPK